MTDKLTLSCVIEGESSSKAFEVTVGRDTTVDGVKQAIVSGVQAPAFKGIAAKDLTFWRVSIPIPPNKGKPLLVSKLDSPSNNATCPPSPVFVKEEKDSKVVLNFNQHHYFATELDPSDDVDVYDTQQPPKKTIHIIIELPTQVHPGDPPPPGSLLSGSRKRAQDGQVKQSGGGIVTSGPIARDVRPRLMLPIVDRDIFKQVFDGLQNGDSFVVHGPYQSGKTSLLLTLYSELVKLSEVAVVGSLDISSFAPSTTALNEGQIIEALSQRLSHLMFGEELGANALDSRLQSLSTTSRCCIFVDEFQVIFKHKALHNATSTFFRALSFRPRVSYVAVGTFKLVELQNQSGELDSPFNKATFLEMPPFDNSEMAKLFEMYAKQFGPRSIIQPIQTEIMLESSGHPASFMILLKLADIHRPNVANWSTVYADNINHLMNGTHSNLKSVLNEMHADQRARVRCLTTHGKNHWDDANPDDFTTYLLNIGILIKHGNQIRFTSGIILRVCIDALWPKASITLAKEEFGDDPIRLLARGLQCITPSTINHALVQNQSGPQEKSFQAALYSTLNSLLPRPMMCLLEAKAENKDHVDLLVTEGANNWAVFELKVNLNSRNTFEQHFPQAIKYRDHFGMPVHLVNFSLEGHSFSTQLNTPQNVIVVNVEHNAACTRFVIKSPDQEVLTVNVNPPA